MRKNIKIKKRKKERKKAMCRAEVYKLQHSITNVDAYFWPSCFQLLGDTDKG